ncbi:MAG: penicillin-insensitive murein endopeptidase [Gaiella sp.]|nr:penicillin-insensitive murein endopeptidase [Gaiella sp.]
MGWRRCEIWLETELTWFRERPDGQASALSLHAPSFFGLPAQTLAVAVPNGLAQSRQRRAELRRRRNTKKARAAALVLGPVVALTVAVPRLGGSARAGEALEDDPPSLTLRLGPAGPEVSEELEPQLVARPDEGVASARSRAAKQTQAPAYREIRWHRATSRGLPYAGALEAGTQLPLEGRDWVTWDPVSDSVPNEPRRLFGNEHTIRTVVSVLAAYRGAHPDSPRVVVGDISFRGGGPMEQHRSHQNGLDVDVYYPRRDRVLRAPAATAQIDRELAQALLDRFLAAGAQMVFVGFSTGLHGPSGLVIPYPNHENHMHVRFPPRPA